ncbi:hypothetical protein [Spiroplasma endosymbiont of Seladonia tumulorum]|uniref:hypothetical protein n=1 Tax=Spiroplasma endosymbiont of Seladonia tumulorum TaxID=3066321 RepID=UPI0030D22541
MKLLKLVKKHKIISIYIILFTIFILCMIVLATLTAITHEKDKKYRTFFERDNTTIVCNKGEKIGKMKIRYKTKDNKNLQKYTIKLYCTNNPIVEGSYPDKLYSIALGGFFNKFEKKWIYIVLI